MPKLPKKFSTNQDGGSVIEFALAGTFVAVCLIFLIDIATAINNFTKLSSGMRAGEQYALKYPNDSSGIAQAIASASNLPASDLTVTSSQFCEWDGVGGSCSASNSGELAKYINVTASYGMGGRYIYATSFYPATLSKSITVRIQ